MAISTLTPDSPGRPDRPNPRPSFAVRSTICARSASIALLLAMSVHCAPNADPVLANEDDEELATQLANPLEGLISIPFQGNYNQGISAWGGSPHGA